MAKKPTGPSEPDDFYHGESPELISVPDSGPPRMLDIIFLRQAELPIEVNDLILGHVSTALSRDESIAILFGFVRSGPKLAKDKTHINFNISLHPGTQGHHIAGWPNLVDQIKIGSRLAVVAIPDDSRRYTVYRANLVVALGRAT